MKEILQKTNAELLSQGVHLKTLRECPEVIPVLVEWLYEDWHSYDRTLTREKLSLSFKERLQSQEIPITFVLFRNTKPIGMVSVKKISYEEFTDFPPDSVWMGSLRVVQEERKSGLGERLVRFAAEIAKHYGYKEIFFYTSDPNNVPWYKKRGAEVLCEREFRDHQITIMKLSF